MTMNLFSLVKFGFPLALALVSLHSAAHGDSKNMPIGQVGNPDQIQRRIEIDMQDNMRFTPDSIKVKQGDTVLFVIQNSGSVKHEFVLGHPKELLAHNEFMKTHPDIEHDEDNMVTVQPGATAELIWQFTSSGTVYFACLQPGHYDAGMKGQIAVRQVARKNSAKPH